VQSETGIKLEALSSPSGLPAHAGGGGWSDLGQCRLKIAEASIEPYTY